jgi:hypothetical protein
MRKCNALRGNRALGPRLAAAAALASIAILFVSVAHAATDTARARRAHPSSASNSYKSSKAKSPAKPAHHSITSIAQSKPAPHSRHRAPQLEKTPPAMHRTHSTPRSRAHEAEQRRIAQMLAAARNAPHTQAASSVSSSQGNTSSLPAVSVKKSLTTEDFMRAAGEDNSPQPQNAMAASVAPYTPAPNNASMPLRIDGFGAEGATLSSTNSRRSTASAPATAPAPNSDDAELNALSHPTHEEVAESALQPRINLYSQNGHLIVPAPLVGSHEILVHQNEMADAEGLDRIENDEQLAHLRAKHLLVDFTESASLQLNPELPGNRRCARPWAVKFAVDMARAYYARFHQPLQINSAVRTVQYQLRLERVNGNAAGVDGEAASPHLTGQALDFGKRGMSLAQIAWMRAYLKPLMAAGKLDVEEEFHQACFHISIYRSYLPSRKPTPRELAQLSAGASTEK